MAKKKNETKEGTRKTKAVHVDSDVYAIFEKRRAELAKERKVRVPMKGAVRAILSIS